MQNRTQIIRRYINFLKGTKPNVDFIINSEPQYSIYVEGVQPVFQVLNGIHLLFMK
ncbi:hypothetical protein [Xanthomarina sp. F2636L]|uniref:hypothetical protein n=1 Tax=Xanthomarina sp. F2636L TaxID=2996018 RepID=UPI00225E46EA|nr:hypothetical protein [Xanthomarina sp. F2636L]MCX7551805.1 hypothetical protein [Xanthomarina sp. F2636L]